MIDAVDLFDSDALEALPGAIRGALASAVLEAARAQDWPELLLVGRVIAHHAASWQTFCKAASAGLLAMALQELQQEASEAA